MSGAFGPRLDGSVRVTISALEFDVLWEHLGLADMPLVLRVPSPGRTTGERADLVAAAWESLGRRGLGRTRCPHPHVERLLRLLARPDREIDARLWSGHSTRVLAAATGDQGVLATLSDRGVTLRPASATGLVREALSVLPTMPAGPGGSVTLPSAVLDRAAARARSAEELAVELRRQDVPARDAAVLRTMLGQVRRHGQFGAAARDRWGVRHRAGRVISFFDGTAGRYLQMRRRAADGQPWSTVSPAEHRLLLRSLGELLAHTCDAAD